MEYIIGRDANTSQLNILDAVTEKLIAHLPYRVPMTVSRKHFLLTIDENGQMCIKNLKAQNVTYVNGHAVESKEGIKSSDNIALGSNRYQLNLKDVLKAIQGTQPKVIDIKPLKAVWEDFCNKRDELKFRQNKIFAICTGTGLITMGAVVLSFLGVGTTVRILCYILAAVFFALTIVIRIKLPVKTDQQMKDLEQWRHKHYVCPNCGKFYNQDYETLAQYDSCPWCKAKFKK